MSKDDYEEKLEEIIHKKRLPILILDNRWQMLFSKEDKSTAIRKLEATLKEAMKRQAKLGEELKELQSLKRKIMSEIVLNMEELDVEKDEGRRQKKLNKSQRLIMDINEKLDKCLKETDEIPLKIKEANEQLMRESVRECYQRMKKNDSEINDIKEWIEKLRIELKRQVLIKQDKEEKNEQIYSYMHDIFGPDYMELFDETDGDI